MLRRPVLLVPLLVALAALLALPAVEAQVVPELLRNINLGPDRPVANDSRFVSFGERALFEHSPRTGRELWVTDGTAAGTRRLTPACPAPCRGSARVEATGGGLALFSRASFDFGTEFWVTDGTPGGTRRILSLPTVTGLSTSPKASAYLSGPGLFVFTIDRRLFVTDGTPEGTRPVRELPSRATAEIVALEDRAIFLVDRQPSLWVTDGTTAGTGPLAVGPQLAISPIDPPSLVRLGSSALYLGRSLDGSFSAWTTDGTEAGTLALASVPGSASAPGSDGSRAFFAVRISPAESQLWTSDGTPEGTRALTDSLDLQAPFGSGPFPSVASRLGRAFFSVNTSALGVEPWTSDGTPEGTRPLGDLCPGTCSSTLAVGDAAVELDERFYFAADDGVHGPEIWSTDGTPAGTRLEADVCPGERASYPGSFFVAGGQLFFYAECTPTVFDDNDRELYRLDPGSGDVAKLTNLDRSLPFADAIGGVSGRLLFVADDGRHGFEPWVSDGTRPGTHLLRDLVRSVEDAGSTSSQLMTDGQVLFFAANDGIHGGELWASDGTREGTRRITDLDSESSLVSSAVRDGEVAFVTTGDDVDQLWSSNATPGSTVLLADIGQDETGWTLRWVGDRIVVLIDRGAVWGSDGTPGGTERIGLRTLEGPTEILDDRLFFFAQGFDGGLWVTDGTADGTHAVFEQPGISDADMAATDDLVFFTELHGTTVWASDGTREGTRVVLELEQKELDHYEQGEILELTRLDARRILVRLRLSPFGSDELWVSDGTEAGTESLFEGPASNFLVFEDRVFFRSGTRFWVSDGTPAGTSPAVLLDGVDASRNSLRAAGDHLLLFSRFTDRLVVFEDGGGPGFEADLSRSGRNPSGFTALGDRIFFTGDDPTVGREVWSVPSTAPRGPQGAPAAPADLVAQAATRGSVLLGWRDRSDDETGFVVEGHAPGEDFAPLAELPAGTGDYQVFGLPTGVEHTFRIRARNELGSSAPSNEASAAPGAVADEPCVPGDAVLCLAGSRFAVRVSWRDPFNGGDGFGHAVPLEGSDESGLFWFFDPANVELIVKVIDGRTVNGAFWFFYGALSTVEYEIEVTDTVTGAVQVYRNPAGEICGDADVTAFPVGLRAGTRASSASAPAGSAPGAVLRLPAAGAPMTTGSCVPSPEALCLLDDRFRVEVEWRDQINGGDGQGRAIPGTEESGFFWFFNAENVELVTKMIDARSVDGHFWFFFGGLSTVEYETTVTDTVTGSRRIYRNPPGEICGRADTTAF